MTVSKIMQEEEIKILRPLFLITDSWLWALILQKPLDFSWGGGHSSWSMSLLCSPLHQLRIKAIFLFPPKTIYFHKGIRFPYSCSFLHCFKTVNRLIVWKEGNLVINADWRSGTANVKKEPKGQREKTFFLFHCSISSSFKVSVVGNGHKETGFLHALLLLLQ